MSQKRQLWAVETGEYEQAYVMFVTDSPQLAEHLIHERFSPPYIVHWEPMTEHDGSFTVCGRFESVQGYSSEHTAYFGISQLDYLPASEPSGSGSV